jgi:hypothetical protein
MLEEDAIRFDTFLKENDKKAHDAIKHAERETKLKQDKVSDIKRLNQAIQAVQSDISKHRESLDDCLRFKAFLDGLTPKDFFDSEARAKAARQGQRRGQRVAEKLAAWEALKAQTAAEFDARKVAEHDALLDKGTSKKKAAAAVAAMRPPKQPARPPVEDEPLTSSGAEPHMYFEAPRQLMEVFTQLEEQNLFLIQNSQETEQALEELRAEFKSTRAKMGRKTEALQVRNATHTKGGETGMQLLLATTKDAPSDTSFELRAPLLLPLSLSHTHTHTYLEAPPFCYTGDDR